jgi:hypothetical protein
MLFQFFPLILAEIFSKLQFAAPILVIARGKNRISIRFFPSVIFRTRLTRRFR